MSNILIEYIVGLNVFFYKICLYFKLEYVARWGGSFALRLASTSFLVNSHKKFPKIITFLFFAEDEAYTITTFCINESNSIVGD